MAQLLGALTVLAGDQDQIDNTLTATHNCLQLHLQNIQHFQYLQAHVHTHVK